MGETMWQKGMAFENEKIGGKREVGVGEQEGVDGGWSVFTARFSFCFCQLLIIAKTKKTAFNYYACKRQSKKAVYEKIPQRFPGTCLSMLILMWEVVPIIYNLQTLREAVQCRILK